MPRKTISRAANARRKQNHKKFNHLYKLFCPNNDLRYVCLYCGLPAPTVDHVPPLSEVEDLRLIYDNIQYTKVPACEECNRLALDEPHISLSERQQFIKSKLKEKYKKYIQFIDWESDEIQELSYNLRKSVEAHMNLKYLIAYRLAYGNEHNFNPTMAGYLEYDRNKIDDYVKAEKWNTTYLNLKKKN